MLLCCCKICRGTPELSCSQLVSTELMSMHLCTCDQAQAGSSGSNWQLSSFPHPRDVCAVRWNLDHVVALVGDGGVLQPAQLQPLAQAWQQPFQLHLHCWQPVAIGHFMLWQGQTYCAAKFAGGCVRQLSEPAQSMPGMQRKGLGGLQGVMAFHAAQAGAPQPP